MPIRILDHTADTGMEVTAGRLAALFEEAILGMVSLMFEIDGWSSDGSIAVTAEAGNAAETLVALLSEILVEIEVTDRVPVEAVVRECSPEKVSVDCQTAPLDRDRVSGPPIKAVTYHDLVCEQSDDGWVARVYFDV